MRRNRAPGVKRDPKIYFLDGETLDMELLSKALEVVARVMREGAATHPDNDWIEHSSEYHLGRAQEHLQLWA
jgi:hypothetical protein